MLGLWTARAWAKGVHPCLQTRPISWQYLTVALWWAVHACLLRSDSSYWRFWSQHWAPAERSSSSLSLAWARRSLHLQNSPLPPHASSTPPYLPLAFYDILRNFLLTRLSTHPPFTARTVLVGPYLSPASVIAEDILDMFTGLLEHYSLTQ